MPSRSRAAALKKAATGAAAVRTFARRVRRILLRLGLVALLAPPAVPLIYRFLPVPITPLMLIRLWPGRGPGQGRQPLAEIAPALAEAAVASEDNQFCEHWGFDSARAQGRDRRTTLAGKHPRGARAPSPKQTAKNLFLWPGPGACCASSSRRR